MRDRPITGWLRIAAEGVKTREAARAVGLTWPDIRALAAGEVLAA